MTIKTAYDFKKIQFDRKIRSVVYLLLPLYINRSTTKYFPIETIPERTDSSIKNLGKVEYDKQNWSQCQKTQAWPKNLK